MRSSPEPAIVSVGFVGAPPASPHLKAPLCRLVTMRHESTIDASRIGHRDHRMFTGDVGTTGAGRIAGTHLVRITPAHADYPH
jgi:hypothetical protein